MDDFILYEHPMNETVRVCLRLECLFKQTEHRLSNDGYWYNRAAIASLIDLVNVLDRPDFKNKLIQQLLQSKEALNRHIDDERIDQQRLHSILTQLDKNINFLQTLTGKLNQVIEKNEFLNSIRLRLSKTGGARNFDLPMYHFWLNQPKQQRKQDIQQWFSEFQPIQNIVQLLLMLIRNSSVFTTVTAEDGYFEQLLNTSIAYQLLRIQITPDVNIFPDISVGRHRMSIHFFALSDDKKPVQTKQNIEFRLACCT